MAGKRAARRSSQRLTFLVGVGGAVALLAWYVATHRSPPRVGSDPSWLATVEAATAALRGDATPA